MRSACGVAGVAGFDVLDDQAPDVRGAPAHLPPLTRWRGHLLKQRFRQSNRDGCAVWFYLVLIHTPPPPVLNVCSINAYTVAQCFLRCQLIYKETRPPTAPPKRLTDMH